MKRDLIVNALPKQEFNQMKMLTTSNIAWELLKIFKRHIGADNAIPQSELFRKVFGKSMELSLADDLRWEYCRRAMHLLRQRTKCFVGSMNKNGKWYFFVIASHDDAQHYIDTLNKNIARMRLMQKKATKSVNENWSKIDWEIDAKQRNQLGWDWKGYI